MLKEKQKARVTRVQSEGRVGCNEGTQVGRGHATWKPCGGLIGWSKERALTGSAVGAKVFLSRGVTKSNRQF